jgi:menaquinone-dependent protoporphyrinogen oxidase
MASILVCYGTGEGQTEEVADRLADELTAQGHDPTTVKVNAVGSDLDVGDFDAVLVDASIHFGRHQKAIRKFVTANRDVLVTKPTGFFQVSGASANEDGAAEATTYVEKCVEATNWRPDHTGLFGGARRFPEYGFLLGALMKRVVESGFPDVDASGDGEFTDGESVDAFATFVEERIGDARSTVIRCR